MNTAKAQKQTQKRVVLVHGYDGAPDRDWFPWLTNELKAQGIEVIAPRLPEPDAPDYDAWLSTLEKAVGKTDTNTHFVGHSLGVPTLLHYLSRLPADAKVGTAVFIAGAMGTMSDPEVARFSSDEALVSKAKSHAHQTILFRSDDDPIISLERSDAFSHALGAEEIWEKGKGHFSEDWDIFEMPQLLEILLKA